MAVKEYAPTAVGVLSSPVRHPKSLGHILKSPMLGKNTQFHLLQQLQVYNLHMRAIMSYFHF